MVHSRWVRTAARCGHHIDCATINKEEREASVQPRGQDELGVRHTTSNSTLACKPNLNDLKEQLFRLEVDHKQKRISQREYERAISSFYQNLQRAVETGNGKSQLSDAK